MAKKKIWEVVLTRPANKVYEKANVTMLKRLDNCFEELEKSPLYGNNIRPLTGELKGLMRYRVGDWRVIYRISDDEDIVEIIAILPRGKAYK